MHCLVELQNINIQIELTPPPLGMFSIESSRILYLSNKSSIWLLRSAIALLLVSFSWLIAPICERRSLETTPHSDQNINKSRKEIGKDFRFLKVEKHLPFHKPREHQPCLAATPQAEP